MRKALFSLILTALFVGGPVVVAPAQVPGNPTSQGQTDPSLGPAKLELQDVDDVIVIVEKKQKAEKERPAAAEPQRPNVAPQQLEKLKDLRDQLRSKIESAEKAPTPTQAQALINDALQQAKAARPVKENVAGMGQALPVEERIIAETMGAARYMQYKELAAAAAPPRE